MFRDYFKLQASFSSKEIFLFRNGIKTLSRGHPTLGESARPGKEEAPRRCRRGASRCESVDKPGSVVDDHSSATTVTSCLKRPTRIHRGPRHKDSYLVLLRVGFTIATPVASRAVRSYRTFSPLPAKAGGILSAALSVGSRPPEVIWHPALWSPDFPPSRSEEAGKRSPDRLGGKTTGGHRAWQGRYQSAFCCSK